MHYASQALGLNRGSSSSVHIRIRNESSKLEISHKVMLVTQVWFRFPV
jgi:hypothetical protein